MTISLITASFTGLLLLLLSINIIRIRLKTQTSLGDGGNSDLIRAQRAQGNLVEYAPTVLILIALIEAAGGNFYLLIGLGSSFFAGRLLHAYGILKEGKKGPTPYRVIGVILTFLSLSTAVVSAFLMGYGLV